MKHLSSSLIPGKVEGDLGKALESNEVFAGCD